MENTIRNFLFYVNNNQISNQLVDRLIKKKMLSLNKNRNLK